MKLTEALKILQQAPKNASPFRVALACGFTPLHVQTFLAAHLQQRFADRQASAAPGLYGDVPGTLASLKHGAVDGVAVPLEWADLDPRLGYREAGAWGVKALPDILSGAVAMLGRIAAALEEIPAEIPIAVSLPTLPLPPIFHMAGWRAGEAQLDLEQKVAEFASRIARRCSLVNSARLAEDSPPAGRYDLKTDLDRKSVV